MAEHGNEDRYINCSRCKMKYHNNNEHIKVDFGYNRLNERYMTCLTCRTNKREYNKCWSRNNYHIYRDSELERTRIYKEARKEKEMEKTTCNVCGSIVSRRCMTIHLRTDKCKKFQQ